MVFIRQGPLSTFEELLVDEELAREAALKEATEAANKRMPTLEEARLGSKAKADVKATKNPLVSLIDLKGKVEV